MRVDTLEAYNIAPDVLAIWRDTIGPELLPVQERAVKEFGLFGDGNLIVFSPTSSGKTFVGEMAAVKAARENTKVFYLVPQKALAEEKFQEFRQRYGKLGIKVVVSSRDHREYDDDIERRDFQIAVVVFEKMQALLVSRPQLMEVVGLVVVDELQLITDETRGPTLELLLTKLRIARSRPRVLGLSAVLGKTQSLAEWLGAKLLMETRRPVELRKGVLCKGTFKYQEHNSTTQGTEPFIDYGSDKHHDLMLGVAEELARRKEQVLVFLPDRATTVSYARMLSARLSLPAVTEAIEELREQEETLARDTLFEVLSNSIAFHNSDLSPEERAIVERHFRSGAIRVLFSTSTLAMGLNLPVKNVVLDGKRWQYLKRYSRWSPEDISKSEYENMSGRAGRLAHTKDFGRSILVTSSQFQADVWLRHYVGSDFEDIVPTLKEAPLENHVLNLLASGMADSRDGLAELLLSSFTGHVFWNQQMSREAFLEALDGALALCVGGGLVRRDEKDGRLAVTDLGRACASKGLGVDTGIALAEWAREARSVALTELEVLTIASLSPAGREVYVNMNSRERRELDFRGELLRRAHEAGASHRPVFAGPAEDQTSLEYEPAKAFKKALFLHDWIDERKTKDIERQFHVWAGALRRVGEEYAWLVEALAAIAHACGWPEPRCREIEVLSDRLIHGVRDDAVAIAKLRVKGLGRVLVRRLVAAGFNTPDAMRAAGEDVVKKALNHRGAFAALWAKLAGDEAKPPTPARYEMPEPELLRVAEPITPYGEPEPPSEPPAQLVIDLRERRVIFRGRAIPTKPPNNLQRQPLLALAVLAARAGEVVTMAEVAEGMFKLGGLRKRPVAPDAKDLRYKLQRPFKRALAGTDLEAEVAQMFETLPGLGLRLNLAGARAEVIGGK
jgi:helicase